MDNITNSDEAKTDQRVKKGVSAKKKSKKAKESVEIVDKIGIVTEEVIEDFRDKVSLHSNNGLTNGASNDHSDEDLRKNDNHDGLDNCERLNDTETKRDDLEVSLSKVQLSNESSEANYTEDTVDSDSKEASECPECKEIGCTTPGAIRFESYRSELQMAEIMRLIQKDLSEPYSIYTYRYFIHNWPKLCFLAMHNNKCIGAIVCKLDVHRKIVKRGYIAMLAVDEKYRKRKIGSYLVRQAIMVMVSDDADEVVLETEITNKPALRLYENLGFVRDKRLFRYYLNGVDALRLKLWLR